MSAVTLALLPLLLLAAFAAPPDGPARIDVAREGEALVVRGIFEAEHDGTGLSYRLAVAKRGPAGASTSRQGGAVGASAPGRPVTLSTVRLGVQPGDTVDVTLTLTAGDRPVAETHHRELVR